MGARTDGATTAVRALSGRAKLWAYVGDMSRVLRNRYPRSRGATTTGRLLPWGPRRPSALRFAPHAEHLGFLTGETTRLLDDARAASRPDGTFAWLDEDLRADPGHPLELWVATRMTHLFSVGHLLGREGDGELADRGIMGLRNAFADTEHGGWFPAVDDHGPTDTHKQAYGHAFVVLAAASSTIAGRPGAGDLLADALSVLSEHFWDREAGAMLDVWDRQWSRPRAVSRGQRQHALGGGAASRG